MTTHRLSISRLSQSLACAGMLGVFASPAQAQEAVPAVPAPVAEPAPVPPAEPAAVAPAASSSASLDSTVALDAPPPAAAKPKPPPYSLPWQLRPVAPGNVVRLDTSFGFYKDPKTDKSGAAVATSLLGSYKVLPDLALIGRWGWVTNSPPEAKPEVPTKTNLLNPVIGGLYGIKLSPSVKLGLFLGVALPMGTGGATNSLPSKKAATSAGIATRSSFDNAMFAMDYLTVFPGVDIAFISGGFTLQGEATLFKLTRVREPATPSDASRTNLTMGAHAGYFFTPFLSVGTEIRHQRWLSTPLSVKNDKTDSVRDTTTFAIGPRLHVKLSEKTWFRPGVSLTLPVDDPMKKAEYKIVQLDLPIAF